MVAESKVMYRLAKGHNFNTYVDRTVFLYLSCSFRMPRYGGRYLYSSSNPSTSFRFCFEGDDLRGGFAESFGLGGFIGGAALEACYR